MEENVVPDASSGRRSEPRTIIGRFHSVEFQISSLGAYYQFRIWDISSKGMCILVKDDSAVLQHLKVGDIMDMKYYPAELSGSAEKLKTKIRHITQDDQGRFKGHYLVGLFVLSKTL